MIDIFNIANTAPQDKSMEYLTNIFGRMNGVLFDPSGKVTGDTITLLGTLFKVFNTALLAVGVLIVVYVIVVGTMKTAHEGEAMGKQWNSLWIPIRIVLGIAGLFPMASGYCLFQIIIMWVIVQGIGAADSLWNTALSYIKTVGSPFAQITVPRSDVPPYLELLFAGITCDTTLRVANSIKSVTAGNYFCYNNSNPFCNSTFPDNGRIPEPNKLGFGPGDVCGTLTSSCAANVCDGANSSSLACKVCTAQKTALASIITQQQLIASNFVQTDYSYRNFYYNNTPDVGGGGFNTQYIYNYCGANGKSRQQCCLKESDSTDPQNKCEKYDSGFFPKPNAEGVSAGTFDPQNANANAVKNIFWPYSIKPRIEVDGSSDFINTQTTYYLNTLTSVVTDYIAQQAQDINKLDDSMKNAASTGWIFAGAFYYTIGRTQTSTLQGAIPSFSFSPGTLTGDYSNMRVNDKAAKDLISLVQARSQASETEKGKGGQYATRIESSNPILKPITDLISGIMNDVANSFANAVAAGQNPMFAIQQLGMTLLMIVEIFFGVFLVITIILGIAGNFSAFVIGTGIINPIGPAMTLVYIVLIPALYGLMGILAAYGGLLGIYVPLIPFIIFTGGVITWFLLVIEAMVAAPLVAIGIMMPSGHHEMMGKAEPALMLVFNIFLRPSLMVLGMLAGMLLSAVLLQMILYTFWQIVIPGTTSNLTAASSVILSWILYLGAFVALVVTVVNKSYATIYLLPERVITWIGGHAAGLGVEAEMEREAKGAVEAGGRGIGGAAAKVGETPKAQREAAHKLGRSKKWGEGGGTGAEAEASGTSTKKGDEGGTPPSGKTGK